MMDDRKLDAYFRRLAVPRPYTADAVSLHVLHRAHQMTVPFENLSIHLSERVSLAENDLIHKIVNRRRGGFCYELNGAFAFVLQAMGVEVKRVAARVYGDDGRMGPPFAHMALVVRASDASGPWLIDVGFGSHSVYPLLFDSRHWQDDPAGSFLLVDTEDGDVDVLKDGKPQYRIEPRERSLADFIPACWWQQTSPDSHFTRSIICSRLTKDGRVSISGETLISTESGSRTEPQLPDDDAVLAAYREHFGIVLGKVPRAPRVPHAPRTPGAALPPPAPAPAPAPAPESPPAPGPAPGTSTAPTPGTPPATPTAPSAPAAPGNPPATPTAPGTPPSQATPAAPFLPGSPLPGPPIQAYPSAGRSWTPPAAQAAPLAESGITGPAEQRPAPVGRNGSGSPDGLVVPEGHAGQVDLL
jgi:arylamine N-acetyltransferase